MANLSPINDNSSKTFDDLFSRFNSLDTDRLLVYLVDSVDSSALPHLAEQFHIMGNEGWLFAKTEQEKPKPSIRRSSPRFGKTVIQQNALSKS